MKFIVIAAAIVASLLVATGVKASSTSWDDHHEKDDRDHHGHHDKDDHDDHDYKKHKPNDDCWNKVDYWGDKDECKSYYKCLSDCRRDDWDGRKKCRDHNYRDGCDDHYHYYNYW
ncbi:hypothetical protein BZG36_05478 [Bifiguratus adelaidae]|uniref:Uncharacterized protein n=1 Tax=Bifiguratus adelaidae TaxID=1938954 RepID=A0A261XTU6_9FUNG|nr:hypothetical protein BZG36_05478 [Bifiguratus adelaidae]